jgi:Fic-DOC domain mobile mystery protein B
MTRAPAGEVPGETPIDLSDLTKDARLRVTTRLELSALEALSIRPVFVKYLGAQPSEALAPFDFAWCLRVHKEMFEKVWTWAGTIRTCDLNIGVPFFNIRDQLQGLLNDLPTWASYGVGSLEQAVRLHHRAVRIHPFPNGNGRWSRLLANIWLKRQGKQIVHWPEDTIGQTSTIRDQYIAAVRAADTGDEQPLIDMHREYQR